MKENMNKQFLYEMLQTPSVSGDEMELQKKVINYMENVSHNVITDEIGNVVNILNPNSKIKVLLTGHIDEIGLMVTNITSDGMLKVINIGGIYTNMYLGQKVRVLTKNGVIFGAVATTRGLSKKVDLKVSDLSIDIGANSKEEAEKFVSLGDNIIFDTDYVELLNDCIAGRALDDRIGAFVILEALRKAKEKGCNIGVYSATTVGEETTKNGAYWVSKRVKPTMAIVVDVTYTSDYVGMNEYDNGKVIVGGGPVLCNQTMVHKKMNQLLKNVAEELHMQVQIEAATGKTCTDLDTIHFSNDGVPTCLVSIPLRYMHSASEVGSVKDIQQCINLIAQFLCTIDETLDLKPL